METLKQSEEILNLGKKIAAEFSEHGRSSLTLSWMSHYLAELILEAEEDTSLPQKRVLQEKCYKTILELWSERANYPSTTRPLSGLKDVVSVLKALKSNETSWRQFIQYENELHWGKYLKITRQSMDDILTLTIGAAISQKDLKIETDWLKHKNLLSENEREILEQLDSMLKDNVVYADLNILDNGPDEEDIRKKVQKKAKPKLDKMSQIFEKLEKINLEQKKNLDELKIKLGFDKRG